VTEFLNPENGEEKVTIRDRTGMKEIEGENQEHVRRNNRTDPCSASVNAIRLVEGQKPLMLESSGGGGWLSLRGKGRESFTRLE